MRTIPIAGADHVLVAELADLLGIDRSGLFKKIKRAGVVTVKVAKMTDGGPQEVSAVPVSYARGLIERYQEARRNG